ncbi:MAG: glycoside hydrolase family 57 protein [Endomicrobia bacterium]|nr:glycoside hydrolase family 57 protein [Endomicrobiia bacterium]
MKKLNIAILYHHHQPYYKDPITNYYHLPWVRLHAIKDYYDTAVWVEKYPSLKLNFNFVPSLILQLDDYRKNALDKHLELTLKPIESLTIEDKTYILKNFFSCNVNTMIYPYRRYKELLDLRGNLTTEEYLLRKINYFNKRDWMDLKVWSNIVWFDPYWRKKDPQIRYFFEKSENFTQEDVELLVNKQRYICGQIISKYKELQMENMIEVSVSAFYHPILPILLNPEDVKISNPQVVLPKNIEPLRDDAKKQIEKAILLYEEKFLKKPRGFWPSEGSVSDSVVELLVEHNIKWFATDEEILKNSLYLSNKIHPKREVIYSHYQICNKLYPIYAIFRDKEISDFIGFVYYKWNVNEAINDLEKKLLNIFNSLKDKQESILVPIILDGENCWEFYQNDGEDFLNELYNMLTSNDLFETVIISDYINKYPNAPKISNIWPGSWINANYNIWIGHPEDNKAWEYLHNTRKNIRTFLSQNFLEEEKKNLCMEEIYAAEGSDWFWWFGDEHFSEQSDIFDFLFRQHLKNIYIMFDQEPPYYLDIPIKNKLNQKEEIILPADFISVCIDGKISNYYEWKNAGKYSLKNSSMHQTSSVISDLYYGFDLENLYIRLDYNTIDENNNIVIYAYFIDKVEEVFYFKSPFIIGHEDLEMILPNKNKEILKNHISINKIVEIKIPFSVMDIKSKQNLILYVNICKNFNNRLVEIQRLPQSSFIEIPVLEIFNNLIFWYV